MNSNRNTADALDNHWTTIRLVGAGNINRNAVGARVYLTTTDGRQQMQDVICGSGLGSGNDMALHFGLGSASISQVHIVWPDRTENVLKDVPADHILQITYPNKIEILTTKASS
jgi:enediyne biosynthesis protein E4